MNAEIRIYPDKEMYAVDMAELMHASIPESGVLQGCALEFTGGNVTIKPGRLVIKGRLAVVVAEGIIEPSELVESTFTGHICAVCNLSDQNEEYVKLQIIPQGSYESMVQLANSYETGDHGDTFNAANGIALLELGTITMTPSGLTGPLTLTEAGTAPKNIRTFVNAVKTALQSTITALTTRVTKLESVDKSITSYINGRAHASSKFKLWNVDYPHATIAAGKSVTITFKTSDYGLVGTWSNNKLTWSNSYKNTTYKETKDANGYRTSFRTFSAFGPQFLEPIAISGVIVRNAASGGKNADDCAVQGWRFTGEDIKITVHNFNTKEAAVVSVLVRMLYVQTE